jgi:hypothetical protein
MRKKFHLDNPKKGVFLGPRHSLREKMDCDQGWPEAVSFRVVFGRGIME